MERASIDALASVAAHGWTGNTPSLETRYRYRKARHFCAADCDRLDTRHQRNMGWVLPDTVPRGFNTTILAIVHPLFYFGFKQSEAPHMQQVSIDPSASSFSSNDYHIVPATEKQIRFARHIAVRTKVELPSELTSDRRRLSRWIDAHSRKSDPSPFADYPSSKQVAFAERIARVKRRDVPRECFRDKTLMSRWIDSNR